MAATIHLETRKTHRYVGSCSHLDQWQHVGRATILPSRLVREGNGIDDQGTYLIHARIPAGQDPKKSRQALRDFFTSEGCSHEYDCCGCRSSWAAVRRIGGRNFSVELHVSRNF